METPEAGMAQDGIARDGQEGDEVAQTRETASSEPLPPPPPASAAPVVSTPGAPPLVKNPWLAGFLSFFPGLGHIYNGLYLRAFVFFAAFAFCLQLIDATEHPIFGMGAAFVWFFGVLDSFRQASLINLGLATDLGTLDQPRRLAAGYGTLITGAVIFLVGFLELAGRYGLWQWEWLVDYWFVVLMLVGLGMVISALKGRSSERRAGDSVMSEGMY